ncbi:hypothetical protein E1283_18675 [Streptomyces hainanensis]|uniref:Uncharacterized protein n=1 Tax=Streptomyces hainanensis TaxID=402648 RepID=A0A4R4TC32_9ACTN|nr:hypothetical protein [Streptomyces hainanensis]TDC73626.1 hypothetical protein E1283_18675 [Streptomyces hainanensis]
MSVLMNEEDPPERRSNTPMRAPFLILEAIGFVAFGWVGAGSVAIALPRAAEVAAAQVAVLEVEFVGPILEMEPRRLSRPDRAPGQSKGSPESGHVDWGSASRGHQALADESPIQPVSSRLKVKRGPCVTHPVLGNLATLFFVMTACAANAIPAQWQSVPRIVKRNLGQLRPDS